ncbi:hypothetical protein K0M31_017444 [Melipona bicolor]|uniref:Uncharacterized protein n=1 Tax=Melipona bicolor TaxID=60889 RepID=A0AA40G532_9HYME|nr:hypothetical protein K0M31_017444 [Melipona bicolor]
MIYPYKQVSTSLRPPRFANTGDLESTIYEGPVSRIASRPRVLLNIERLEATSVTKSILSSTSCVFPYRGRGTILPLAFKMWLKFSERSPKASPTTRHLH